MSPSSFTELLIKEIYYANIYVSSRNLQGNVARGISYPASGESP